jgi:hypothetical protein
MGKLRNAEENLHPSTLSNPSFLHRAPNPLPKTLCSGVRRCLIETSGVVRCFGVRQEFLAARLSLQKSTIINPSFLHPAQVHDFKDPKLGA